MMEKKEFQAAADYLELDKLFAYLADDVEIEVVPLGEILHGKEAFKRYVERIYDTFSDRSWELVNAVMTENTMALEVILRATHTGPYLGYAPTGKRVEFKVCRIFSLRDGLIHHGRIYYDVASILRQIGALEEFKAA